MLAPSVQRIVAVARELGPLADEVVFIGGAIAPLLHTQPPFTAARVTKDVDAIAASTRYTDAKRWETQLQKRGFRQRAAAGGHAHRWESPSGILLDLVPAGTHLGGSGSLWDAEALESAVTTIADGVTLRHAAAPAFAAMKLAAFADRGRGDLRSSHDVEDVIALIASRASIVPEITAASSDVRNLVGKWAVAMLRDGTAEEVAAAHLNNATDAATATRETLQRLTAIAALV
jgi:predicted nucleotidyltransferase